MTPALEAHALTVFSRLGLFDTSVARAAVMNRWQPSGTVDVRRAFHSRPRKEPMRLVIRSVHLGLVLFSAMQAAIVHAKAVPADAHAIATQGLPPGVVACQACHGPEGEGNLPAGFPRLAGLGRRYLAEQLASFASAKRQSPVMQPIAAAMSTQQQAAMAGYYSAMAAPPQRIVVVEDPAPAQAGAWLAARGRWPADIPACSQCHGAQGLGVGESFPPLAGQPAAYIVAQLQSWKHGTRPPGPQSLMSAIAANLSEQDMNTVADYSAGVPEAPIGPAAPTLRTTSASAFEPPPEAALPDGEFGKIVRQGEQIFLHTRLNAGAYVGNTLDCAGCHLDAGRRARSAPMWGAYVAYPAFRSKDGAVSTFAARMQGCFLYSMNGKAPPLGDPVLVALESYAYWLAQGAPVGTKMEGAEYPKLPTPALAADFTRGQHVYDARCALCHGPRGQGQVSGGQPAFPPLWGPQSFNWGAGMHQVGNAAGFIKANMPLSQGDSLSDQEAWDVALFMDSQDRPQDPRFADSVEATRIKFHDSPDSMYGRVVDGHLLGSGRP
jgi:thiosulfate dehydrogenase